MEKPASNPLLGVVIVLSAALGICGFLAWQNNERAKAMTVSVSISGDAINAATDEINTEQARSEKIAHAIRAVQRSKTGLTNRKARADLDVIIDTLQKLKSEHIGPQEADSTIKRERADLATFGDYRVMPPHDYLPMMQDVDDAATVATAEAQARATPPAK